MKCCGEREPVALLDPGVEILGVAELLVVVVDLWVGEGGPKLPCPVRCLKALLWGWKRFWWLSIGANGRCSCHGTEGDKNDIAFFDMNQASSTRSGRGEVYLVGGDGVSRGERQGRDLGVLTLSARYMMIPDMT